jgi:hypothetical protein
MHSIVTVKTNSRFQKLPSAFSFLSAFPFFTYSFLEKCLGVGFFSLGISSALFFVTRPTAFHTWAFLGIYFAGWRVHEMYNASWQFTITATFVLVSRYAIIKL